MSHYYLPNRRLFLGALSTGLLWAPYASAKAVKSSPALGEFNAVSVVDFGAKGNGQTIDSPAINAAIDYVASKGGGVVYFPAGTYASYTIRLKSNIRLHLEQGATILAASTPKEGSATNGYDIPDPIDPKIVNYQDFGHNTWKNSLIFGEGLHNIAITGTGRIWGKGLSRGLNWTQTPPAMYKDDPISSRPGVGEKAIALKNCINVIMRDFEMLEAGWFAILATGVDNLTIDNLTIDTNRDGMDIDCCKNVIISNCKVNSPWDDGICPKSSYALGYARATENMVISNCIVSGKYEVGSMLDGTFKVFTPLPKGTHGRIKLGTESNGGFKNITITNCVFDKCRGIALETVDGGQLEDVTITNISMVGCTTGPIFMRLGSRMRGPSDAKIGTLKRIIVDNIVSSSSAQLPSLIAGIDGYYVEDIKLSNLFLQQVGGATEAMANIVPPENNGGYPEPNMFGDLPATGFFFRHARNVELSHVEIEAQNADARPAFWLQDVKGFDAEFIKIRNISKSSRKFILNQVSDFSINRVTGLEDKRAIAADSLTSL